MSRSIDLEGVHGTRNALDFECADQFRNQVILGARGSVKVGPNRFRVDFFANIRPPSSSGKTANSPDRALLAVVPIAVRFLVPKVQMLRNWFDGCCLSKYEKVP